MTELKVIKNGNKVITKTKKMKITQSKNNIEIKASQFCKKILNIKED